MTCHKPQQTYQLPVPSDHASLQVVIAELKLSFDVKMNKTNMKPARNAVLNSLETAKWWLVVLFF